MKDPISFEKIVLMALDEGLGISNSDMLYEAYRIHALVNGFDVMSKNKTAKAFAKMVEDGKIEQDKDGCYIKATPPNN